MTAEIFLAVFLASLLVAVVQWVFLFTVYRPLQRWLANRSWDSLQKSDRCIDRSCPRNRHPGSLFCQEHGPGQPVESTALFAEYPAHLPMKATAGFDVAAPSDFTEDAIRSFHAGADLQLAALDVSDGYAQRLHDAARSYREATSPIRAKEIREMAQRYRAMRPSV